MDDNPPAQHALDQARKDRHVPQPALDQARKDSPVSRPAPNLRFSDSPVAQRARELVRRKFPEADAAFLGGSSAAGTATATSDLDIAVLRPAGYETFRDTTREDGRLVEWFVHAPETVGRFLDEADRRAVMAHIYGHGIVLVNSNGAADAVAARARAILQAGPARRDALELEELRYGLTDAYDDLTDAKNEHEQLAIADIVTQSSADLLCELRGSWTGRGKWLPRRVHEADADLGPRLTNAWLTLARSGDAAPLLDVVGKLLDEVGGPLREGFRRTAAVSALPSTPDSSDHASALPSTPD